MDAFCEEYYCNYEDVREESEVYHYQSPYSSPPPFPSLLPSRSETTKLKDIPLTTTRDWNQEFQALLDKRLAENDSGNTHTMFSEENDQLIIQTRLEIGEFAKQFVQQAVKIGKIIISEFSVGKTHKTIPPIDIGGIAGGLKYIHDGMFFKFVVDENKLFGGDQNAMKTANHELRGLQEYMNLTLQGTTPKLRWPLATIINYRGYCIMAYTILPITKHTIIYGSADGGKTVHDDIDEVNEMMKKAAKKINIAGHYVGAKSSNKNVTLYSCGDIECHQGKDERYYILDTHRVMPPMSPDKSVKGGFLIHLLRPEFIRRYYVDHVRFPLSPDAFSGSS